MAALESGEFVQLLTKHQSRLFAYIFSLIGNHAHAEDVLQETNAVLWQKRDQFQAGTAFSAWALKTAYLQIMASRQKRVREKLVFDSPLIQEMSRAAEQQMEHSEERRGALKQCMEKLSPRHRELVLRRYSAGASIDGIGQELGLSADAVKQALYRARAALIECIKRSTQGATA
jgi:RNA polymerase sigma-70 factor, ECF subfamily